MISAIKDFLKLESSSGIILFFSTILALIIANSPLTELYDTLLETRCAIIIGSFSLSKPLLLWINDALMAVFFFLVGLELKREMLEGELSSPSQIILPGVGAVGGMIFPALFYYFINQGDAQALKGWAIPAATDIAFALGILSLFGRRVPTSLKIFLVSLAIFDDIGAIVIIAVFYTSELSLQALILALMVLIGMFILNRKRVKFISAYFFLGLILWVAVLKSGVHATLAGVVAAFFIPNIKREGNNKSMLVELEHGLHYSVAFGILPLFAFANAGINLSSVSIDTILSSVPLGIITGLFLGKQLGIFIFCYISVKLGIAKLSGDMSWKSLYGVAVLCGVGFTMSLFIGSLAFEQGGPDYGISSRLGIIIGSLLSGIAGFLYLNYVLGKDNKQNG